MKKHTDNITIGRDPLLPCTIIQLVAERERRRLNRKSFWSSFRFPYRKLENRRRSPKPLIEIDGLGKAVILYVVLLIIWGLILAL
jgi:hypothetical protein